ncbi:sugar-binding protein [Pedobacter psychroterrae]|nr:sugar-binding protein [Pedobacter psychroterrae]
MKKTICFLLLFTALLGPGCQRNQKPTIAFIAGAATDFWTLAENGCNQAAKELPEYNVIFKYTTDGATEEQKRLIEDLLVNNVSGIVVSPLDPVNQSPLIDKTAEQIPVIITDSDIPGSKRLCYVGTSNIDAGKSAGQLIKEALPAGGKVMLFVGKSDAQNAKERIAGIEAALKGSNITIAGVKTDNIDRVRAKANVNDVLVSNPEINCFVGLWSYNGPAILNAVRESNKLEQVKIVCFDEEEETLQGVKKGDIVGTVVQQPYEFGYQSIHLLAKYISGNKNAVPAGKQIIIPATIINQANVDAFIAKMQTVRKK